MLIPRMPALILAQNNIRGFGSDLVAGSPEDAGSPEHAEAGVGARAPAKAGLVRGLGQEARGSGGRTANGGPQTRRACSTHAREWRENLPRTSRMLDQAQE